MSSGRIVAAAPTRPMHPQPSVGARGVLRWLRPLPHSEDPMKIGALSQATGTPVETIRYYEREGLLPPPARAENNYRQYTKPHVQRLAFIRQCRHLDMSLEEVRALLALRDASQPDCSAVNDLLDAHIGHVVHRVAELQALEATLRALRSQCDAPQPVAACGILGELERSARSTPAPSLSPHRHVQGAR
jgi:Cd(II)/Pb(II)-responsive transcriptional regulator